MRDIQSVLATSSTFDVAADHEAQPVPAAWVEKVFLRLGAQLGHKIADLYAGVPPDVVKAEWGMAMTGFQPQEIGRGLAACQTRVFAPTLGEFLRLCRPALDPETAAVEAVEILNNRDDAEWSHPAVRRAALAMAFELRTQAFAQYRRRWTWILEREFSKGWDDPRNDPRLCAPVRHAPERPEPEPEDDR